MRVFFFVSIAICTFGVASGLRKATQSVVLSPSLKARGGAGPLPTTVVAKVAVAGLGVEGLMGILCPEAITGKGFGLAINDETVIIAKGIGFADFAIFAGASQLFFQDMDLDTAITAAFLVHLISGASGLINGDAEKLGSTKNGLYFWLVINSALLYGLVNGTDWAIPSVKAVCALLVVSCGMLAMAPARGLQQYGREKPLSLDLEACVRAQGAVLVKGAIMLFALASGADVTKAIGFGFIAHLLHLVNSLFIVKDMETLKVDLTPLYLYMFFCIAVVGTLAF